MKKITLFKKLVVVCLTILSQTTFAQTWEMSDNTAFGTSISRITSLHSFKGSIYAGLTMNNAFGARLFSSYSGDNATWFEPASFASAINMDEYGTSALNSTTAGGGYMFLGTKNNTTGPRIYKSFDGFTWDTLQQIPYGGMLMYDIEISSIACFNPTGSEDDTLFVAVENSMNTAEIWKNYITGGTWTKVASLTGTTRVNDMVEFNNKLYACTSGGLIYESADGNNWTMNMPADTGFNNNNNYSFKSMAVFQNRLYVTANNSTTGAEIWNTSDGLTWSPVMTGGFTNGSSMNQINDLLTANGKLWVSAESFLPGLAFSPSGTEAGRGGSLYTYIYNSTDGTNFINQNNDGFTSIDPMAVNRLGTLEYFNNFVYQATDNSGYAVAGEVWRGCLPPTPNIAPLNGSACLGAPKWINDTLYTAITNEWYVDDTLLYSGYGGFNYIPTSLGTKTIKLIERNGGCADSATTTITVYPNPTAIPTSALSICNGNTLVMFDTITGGTGPYVVTWDDEGSNFFTGNPISFPATSSITFSYVIATDANGCSTSSGTGFIVIPSTDLVGHAGYSGGDVTTGNAVAFKFIPGYTYFDTVQVASLDASGNFIFTALTADDYLIKIFADTLIYPTLNATYFGDSWAWDSALVITHGCGVVDTANITMVEELGLTGGPGNLRGRIVEDVGFGGLAPFPGGMYRLPGEPIPGIDVKLGKNPGGAMMGSTTTSSATASDGGGFYYFTNVPLNSVGGSYTVYVDIPGLGRDSSYTVVLDPTTNQFLNLDYLVDSTTIFIVNNSGVGISNPDVAAENKFGIYPNPFKGETKIVYHLAKDASVSLDLYNVVGEKIRNMINEKQQMGDYKYNLSNLNAGIYFVTLSIDGVTTTQRVVQVK